jgi:hypothetical protein
MTKLAGTLFWLVAVAVLADASAAQNQFPETEFGSDPVEAGKRGPVAAFVAPLR